MILYKQKQKSIYLMIVKLFFLGISIPKILAKENNDDCEVFKKFISEMGASVDYDVSEKCCSYNSNTVYCDSGQITKLELRSKKHFQGLELSSEIGNFKHLVKLDLKSNDLTGEIPESIGNLTNLKYLDISDNRFKGKLPKSIENLVNLETFNLNSNYGLEGTIPALPKLVKSNNEKTQTCFLEGSKVSSEKICTKEEEKEGKRADNGGLIVLIIISIGICYCACCRGKKPKKPTVIYTVTSLKKDNNNGGNNNNNNNNNVNINSNSNNNNNNTTTTNSNNNNYNISINNYNPSGVVGSDAQPLIHTVPPPTAQPTAQPYVMSSPPLTQPYGMVPTPPVAQPYVTAPPPQVYSVPPPTVSQPYTTQPYATQDTATAPPLYEETKFNQY